MSIQDIPGQSVAGMLDMFSSKPTVRTWRVEWPSSKRNKPMDFTSVQTFDGFISEARKMGALVTFKSPFLALVEVSR